jgi:hypothetical protein
MMENKEAELFALGTTKLVWQLMFSLSTLLFLAVAWYHSTLWWNPQVWWSYCITSLNFFGCIFFLSWWLLRWKYGKQK